MPFKHHTGTPDTVCSAIRGQKPICSMLLNTEERLTPPSAKMQKCQRPSANVEIRHDCQQPSCSSAQLWITGAGLD